MGRVEVETEEGGVRGGGGQAIPHPGKGPPDPPSVSPMAGLPGRDHSRGLASLHTHKQPGLRSLPAFL